MNRKCIDVDNLLLLFILLSLYSCNNIKTQEPRNDTLGAYQETIPTNNYPTSTNTITPTSQVITETKTVVDISPTNTLANNILYPLLYASNNEINEMDIDELTNIHNTQILLSNVTNEMELITSITLSPDGSKLLLGIDIIRQGTHLDIYDINSGKKIESLGNPNLYSIEPAWSNDGKFVAYGNYNPDSVIRIDPTNECLGNNCLIKYFRRQNTDENGDLTDPIWTKDDREIVFLFQKGRKADLCIGFIETLNYKCPITGKEIGKYSINNENQIIFDDFSENGDSIYLFDLNQFINEGKSVLLKLSPENASFYSPIFSKNGEEIFYISDKNDQKDIYYSEIKNKIPDDWIGDDHQLTDDNYSKYNLYITNDGKMLLYSADTKNPKKTTIITCIKSLWMEEISKPPYCISGVSMVSPIWGNEIKFNE